MTAEVLAEDEEYAEVIQDLHEECGKYGAIRAVHVPRPPNPKVLAASVFGTGTYGKVRCPPTQYQVARLLLRVLYDECLYRSCLVMQRSGRLPVLHSAHVHKW